MSSNNKGNFVMDDQKYNDYVAKVREAKDPTHKKGKKVLIDHCQNVLKYNLNPAELNYAVRYLQENAQNSAVLAEYKDKINTKEFKAERAEYILRNGFIDLEEAVNYVKENDANNPLLKQFNVDDIEAFKEERARDMAQNKAKYRVSGRFDPHVHAADNYLDGLSKNEEKEIVEEAEKVVDLGKNKIPAQNSEAIEKNRAWIKTALKEQFEKEDEKGVPAWRRHNADVLDRIKFVDDEGKENDEIRKKSESTIWEIAKNEVLRERSFDFSFMKLKEEDKLKQLRADLSDSVAKTSLGIVGITPVLKRKVNGKITTEELAEVDAQISVSALDKYLSDKGDKAQASQNAVVGAAIHESEKAESFIGYIEKNNYSKNVVDGFKQDHKSFKDKMKTFWGNLWTQGKEYVANNRTRLVVDTVATLAVASLPVTYGAVAAYAAYATIGSVVWPIVEKRRKVIRQAKKEGRNYDDYKLGLKFNGLRKAWKDIKSNEKEFKRYKNRAKTGAVAGIVVAGGLGALGTGLVNGVSAMAAKVGGTITRSLASVTSQALNFKDTRKDLKLEDNAENRAAYKSAKWGLGIGLTIATLVSAWGIYNMLDSQADAGTPKGNLKGDNDQAQEAAQKAVKKTAKATKKVADVVDKNADISKVKVPTEWKEDSGVGQNVWADVHGGVDAKGNVRMGKVTGILSRTNAGFDRWNAAQTAMYGDAAKELLVVNDAKVTIQDIYQNIANARAENPKIFGNMNDQQVFVAYVKLVEQTEITMNGPKVEINGKMVSTLISRIDKDGLPMYNNEYIDGKLVDHNSNMKKLFMLIRCGKKVDISAEDVNAELSRIDLKSGRGIGEAFSRGVTNNVMVGEQGCQGVSIWRKGLNAVKKVFTKEDPKVDTKVDTEVTSTQTSEISQEDAVVTSVKTVEQADANVRSVQVRELDVEDGKAQAVYTSTGAVMGRGTSGVHDGDLTDEVAQSGKKVGGKIEIKGTSRKLEGACWVNSNTNGGGREGM